MASLLIRKLDDDVKARLRVRAAKAGRSMEEEARLILTREAEKEPVQHLDGPGVLALMRELFGEEHGVDLEIPERNWGRPPVDFSE
ncbi:MAG: hypothetical protein QM759_16930 [Terricaulis sp.]